MGRKLIFVKLIYSPVQIRSERIAQKRVARLAPGFVRERHNYLRYKLQSVEIALDFVLFLQLKRTYDGKCRESESQDITIENIKSSGQQHNMKQGEFEKVIKHCILNSCSVALAVLVFLCPTFYPFDLWLKMVAKQSKAGIDANNAERAYKDMLSQLENARKAWEAEMIKMCDVRITKLFFLLC